MLFVMAFQSSFRDTQKPFSINTLVNILEQTTLRELEEILKEIEFLKKAKLRHEYLGNIEMVEPTRCIHWYFGLIEILY